MKLRRGTSLVLVLGLILAVVPMQVLAASKRDPHEVPTAIGTDSTIGALAPVLAGSGSDTIFLLYSTTSDLSSTSPRRVKIQIFTTAGANAGSKVASITDTNGSTVVLASQTTGVSGDGIAVLRTVSDSTGETTTSGFFGGTAWYVDAGLGVTYERPLIFSKQDGTNWPAFNQKHQFMYAQMGDFKTQLHIICPSASSSTATIGSTFAQTLSSLGAVPNNGSFTSTSTNITGHFDIQAFNTSGTSQGSLDASCRGANFQVLSGSSIGPTVSGQLGLLVITGSQATAHGSESNDGDLIAWRTIKFGTSVLDARALTIP